MSEPFNPPKIVFPKRSQEQKLLELGLGYGMTPERLRKKLVDYDKVKKYFDFTPHELDRLKSKK